MRTDRLIRKGKRFSPRSGSTAGSARGPIAISARTRRWCSRRRPTRTRAARRATGCSPPRLVAPMMSSLQSTHGSGSLEGTALPGDPQGAALTTPYWENAHEIRALRCDFRSRLRQRRAGPVAGGCRTGIDRAGRPRAAVSGAGRDGRQPRQLFQRTSRPRRGRICRRVRGMPRRRPPGWAERRAAASRLGVRAEVLRWAAGLGAVLVHELADAAAVAGALLGGDLRRPDGLRPERNGVQPGAPCRPTSTRSTT